MNPEDFYAAKRKRIFWGEMIFYSAMFFIVVIGSSFVYLVLEFW